MKKLRTVLIAVLALMTFMAMSATAFAHTISVTSTDTHTYRVYQVLTGTLSEEGSSQLGDAAWGADVIEEPGSVDAFVTAITAEGISQQDVAQLVAAKVDPNADGRGTVSKDHPLSDLPTGYYVLIDETQLTGDHALDTKSLHVIKVVNDINGFDIKWGTTGTDKIITSDTLGSGDSVNPVNGKVDNVSIGDTVNYQITATVPANADLYNYFYFVINDTLDPGLTLNAESIKVYKDSVSNENQLSVRTDYLVKTGTDASPKSFEVGLTDAKSLAGKNIIVTYSAVLNENATIGEIPNENTNTVTFSNDPNHDYGGENNPGFPDQEDLKATGETPESITKTFTTGIELQKVDENGNVLTGAEFKLTGESAEIVLVSSEEFTEAADGEYYGLNNGTYTKEAPVTEDYMKEAEAGAAKGYVAAEAGYEGDDAVTVGGVTYRPYREGDTGQVYILVKANADQYNGKRYNKTVTYTQKDTKTGVEVKAEVGEDGVLRFVGLGAGTYTITETKTPEGYNTIDPVTIKIDFTADPEEGAVHWSTTSEGATYNASTGVFEMKIENKKGPELPSTGGMGTTIFYVLGGALVLIAGVMLIARRRVSASK